jgi:medium-chain acyl-[acyl-carrier-protein] hydrolase
MLENWILRPRPNPQARLRLLCFHTAGRGASMFVPWAKLFPGEIELCCVQLPGRENRSKEKPYNQIGPILECLDEALFPLFDRPFAIFGPSMGALVGFEFARKLRDSYHLDPTHLFFASRRSPQAPDRLPNISHLPPNEFLDGVQKRYNSIPEVIRKDQELMDIFLPVMRADFSVIENYNYVDAPPFDCPLSVIRGSTDAVMLPEDFRGWEKHTHRSFASLTFAGSHFFFNEQPARVVEFISGLLLN